MIHCNQLKPYINNKEQIHQVLLKGLFRGKASEQTCFLCFCPRGNNVSLGHSSGNPEGILVTHVRLSVLETHCQPLPKIRR